MGIGDQLNSRKLLMLTYSYPPRQVASTFRVVRFTRFLPEFGWRCVVVTPVDNCFATVDQELLRQVNPATVLRRFRCGDPAEHCRKWLYRNGSRAGSVIWLGVKAFSRLVDFATFPDSRILGSRRLLRAAMQAVAAGGIDAVWLTGPPFSCFSIVPSLKQATGLSVILDLRDPWTTSRIRYTGRNRWKLKRERRQERRVFECADRVVLNTRHACREYQALYPDLPADKWCVLPNTYDPEDFANLEPERFPCRVLLHGGVTGGIRTARSLIEAMGRLRVEGMITPESFRYISYGTGGRDEHEAARRAQVADMVEFRGARPHREVLASMSGADALFLIVGSGHDSSIPSKLYEYLGVGRPVLMTGPADCAAADLVRETGVGPVVAPGDVDGLEEALRALITGRSGVYEANPERVATYQTRSVTRALSEVLDSLTFARAAAVDCSHNKREVR